TAMAAMITSGIYHAVLGSRVLGRGAIAGGMPIYKYVANRFLTLAQNLCVAQKLTEYHTGYRAFSREVLLALPLEENSNDVGFGRRSVVECARCRLMSTSPPLARDEARRLYSDAYYSGNEAARFRLGVAERAMRAFRRRRARGLARALGGAAGKRILDVGCGRGFTLQELQAHGADVYGTQMSAPAVGVAEALIGAGRVFLGELSDAGYAPASFDCVTLWHVLEHVPRPADLLIEVARVLKPGGLAYIE